MILGKKVDYTNAYLNEVLGNSGTESGNLYFVWNQCKRMSLKKLAGFDNESSLLCDELYKKSYDCFEKELKEYKVEQLRFKRRHKNRKEHASSEELKELKELEKLEKKEKKEQLSGLDE